MVNVITYIEILCPLDKVSQFATDPDNVTAWYKNIKYVEWITPRPLAIGSQIAFIAHFLGKKISYTYEVVEMTPVKFVMKTAEGPFPMETTYTWERLNDNATKMYLQNKGEPKGFSKIFSSIMGLMMKRANNNDLKLLKKILEK